MRVTTHGGSRHKNGKAYSPKHNDRQFDVNHADNIRESDIPNFYIHRYSSQEEFKQLTFEQAEMKFYNDTYGKYLESMNARNVNQRHSERVQTMEQFKEKHPPYELICQIGNRREHADVKTLKRAVSELNNYINKAYPQFKVIDIAGHFDEQTPHFQIRGSWVAHDDRGDLFPSQNRSLEEMGVCPPDMTKVIGRHNNRLQTFSSDIRERFQAICIDLGLEIETKPLEGSKQRRTTLEYQCDKLQAQYDTLESRLGDLEVADKIMTVLSNNKTLQRELISSITMKEDSQTIYDINRYINQYGREKSLSHNLEHEKDFDIDIHFD